jgi:hypothetical protein
MYLPGINTILLPTRMIRANYCKTCGAKGKSNVAQRFGKPQRGREEEKSPYKSHKQLNIALCH